MSVVVSLGEVSRFGNRYDVEDGPLVWDFLIHVCPVTYMEHKVINLGKVRANQVKGFELTAKHI